MLPSMTIEQKHPRLDIYIGAVVGLDDLFDLHMEPTNCKCLEHSPAHKFCAECGQRLSSELKRTGTLKRLDLFGGDIPPLSDYGLKVFLQGHFGDIHYQGNHEATHLEGEARKSIGLHHFFHEQADMLLLGHKLESLPLPLSQVSAGGISTRNSWTGVSMNFNFAKELLEEFGLEGKNLGQWIVIR